jgi:hypothetical protein
MDSFSIGDKDIGSPEIKRESISDKLILVRIPKDWRVKHNYIEYLPNYYPEQNPLEWRGSY